MQGVARRAYGKLLHLLEVVAGKQKLSVGAELPFSGVANVFTSIDEVKNAGKYPDDKQILKYVNRDVIAAARNKAQQLVFDEAGIVKPTIENDSDMRLKDMIKLLKAAGQSEDEAETNARIMLKMDARDESSEDEDDEE